MVRTRADNCSRKAVASKAPRKNFNAGSSSSSAGASEGGSNSSFNLVNHAKMWPTPKWQKGIGSFFQKSENENCSENRSEQSASNLINNKNKETDNDKIINLDAENNEKTKNSSDKENEKENTTDSLNSKDVNENELPKKSKKTSGKQKACVSGKVISKKKRRVVLEDSSDEE